MVNVFSLSNNKQTQKLLALYVNEYEDCTFFEISDISSLKDFSDSAILIADVSDSESYLSDILDITKSNPRLKVLVLSDNMTVDLIVRSMRAGAKEFLPLPLIKSEFADVMNRLILSFADDGSKKIQNCKIISVFSNKGGIGKTSVATNLALELANVTKEKVALIDLNFQLGDVTTFMDINPSFNVSYVLENLDKINDEFLMSTLERYKQSSLYVLADTPVLRDNIDISNNKLNKLFSLLKDYFSFIVVDLDSAFDEKNINLLSESDLIMLVTVANLPAIRNVQRCEELFERLGFDDGKIQLLLNRYMENDEVDLADIEKVTGKKIYWKVPNNYFTMMSSINKGIPVCVENPASNVAISYRNLALKISSDIYSNNAEKIYTKVTGGTIGT